MRPNPLRKLLDEGKPSIGTHTMVFWPGMVEIIGHTGIIDYVEFVARVCALRPGGPRELRTGRRSVRPHDGDDQGRPGAPHLRRHTGHRLRHPERALRRRPRRGGDQGVRRRSAGGDPPDGRPSRFRRPAVRRLHPGVRFAPVRPGPRGQRRCPHDREEGGRRQPGRDPQCARHRHGRLGRQRLLHEHRQARRRQGSRRHRNPRLRPQEGPRDGHPAQGRDSATPRTPSRSSTRASATSPSVPT